MNTLNPKQTINVDLDSLKTVLCNCGNNTFDGVSKFKVVPALYSPTGQPTLAAIPMIRCTSCKAVYTTDAVMKNIQE